MGQVLHGSAVVGGVGYGVYTMALIELGERFSGSALVACIAAFGLMWGVGGILGPPCAGVVMERIGAPGLPVVIATLSGFLVVFAIYRAFVRRVWERQGKPGDGAGADGFLQPALSPIIGSG
jgi:hypothetical protein